MYCGWHQHPKIEPLAKTRSHDERGGDADMVLKSQLLEGWKPSDVSQKSKPFSKAFSPRPLGYRFNLERMKRRQNCFRN